MILLFSLMIYNSREREMVELYNTQQMAIARGVASGIEHLITGVEQGLETLAALQGADLKVSLDPDRDLKFISGTLKGKVEFIGRYNSGTLNAYPVQYKFRLKKDLASLISTVKKSGKVVIEHYPVQYPPETQSGSGFQSESIIIAVPELDPSHHVSGVLFAGISLSNVVQKYIESVKYDLACTIWAIDNRDKILYHPNAAWIGQDIAKFEGVTSPPLNLKSQLINNRDGYGVFKWREKEKVHRILIAHAPIRLGNSHWSIAVSTPYQAATAQLKLTYYLIMVSAFFLIAASVIGSLFMVRSGKERIRLEEELKHLREKNALQEKLAREKSLVDGIIEGSPIPTMVINREHRVILWNKACADLTGYSSQEMIGTDNHYMPFYSHKRPLIADLIMDNDMEGLQQYYDRQDLQRSTTVEGAYEAYDLFERLTGGKKRSLYFLAAPIYNEQGELIAVIETFQDISREKEMDEALKDYNESLKNELDVNINLRKNIEELYAFLQSIIVSSPDKIFAMDSNGMVSFVSRGVGPRKLMFKENKIHLTELVDPENKSIVLEKWEASQRGIFTPYELEARARDGSKRHLLISVTPIKETDNYIIVQRDITEFKNLEKKFYEAQQLAALGQLAAGIAHEVRNPLSSIKMSLQILEKRLQPEGNDLKRFKIAEKEVVHLEQLVNDILIYARPTELEPRSIDLNALVKRTLESAEKEIVEKNIYVSFDLDKTVATVSLDEPKLGRTLLNLYLNAIDAMKPGGKLIVSTKAVHGRNRKAVEIAIEDTGAGISEKDLPYIFNPFFTRKSYGTGLGLAQVKKIVDLHQGNIEIFSKEGNGTRIVITLPASAGGGIV